MKKIFTLFLFCSICTGTYGQQQPLFNVTIDKPGTIDSMFLEVRQLILQHYYYDGLSENDLNWAAINGMLRHISPPETPSLAQLWTDEEYEKILNSLKGVKVTMGFNSTFNSADGSLTVTSLIEDSEAEKKLQINDRILRIDGKSLAGMQIDQVNQLLDGEVGEPSTLKVVRDVNVFDIRLKRDSLKVKNLVVSEIPNHNAALIELRKVTVGMADELRGVLTELVSKGTTNIVLDLRNNVGGVLNEGINIARLFMKKNDIVLRTQSSASGVTNYIADTDQFYTLKLIVLINENSASAAEIIASALKDHGRGTLVGKKTFGKGVIETTYTLKNNFRVKFITSAMYGPKGKSWQSTGLLPDYYIDQTPNNYIQVSTMNIVDRQRFDLHLSTALKLLQE